jgi:hypothetical protein
MRRLLVVLVLGSAGLLAFTASSLAGSSPSPSVSPSASPGSAPAPASAAGDATPAPPSVASVTEKTTWRLTNCDAVGCWLRDVVDGSGQENLVITLRRTGPASPEPTPTPTAAYLVLQGDHHGQPVTFPSADVTFTPAAKDGGPARVTVNLDGKLRADHYTGALVAEISTGSDSIDVPVDVSVRNGPLWPIVWLLGAVLLGFIVTTLFDQRPKVSFQDDADDFLGKCATLPKAEQAVLLRAWQQVRQERDTNLTTAQTHLTALIAGIGALRHCRNVQDEALRTPGFDGVLPWVQRIGLAVNKVTVAVEGFATPYEPLLGQVDHAMDDFKGALDVKQKVELLERRATPAQNTGQPYTDFLAAAKAVQDALKGVPPDPSQPAPDLTALLAAAEHAFQELEDAHGGPLPEPAGKPVAAGVVIGPGGLTSLLGWPLAAAEAGAAPARTGFDSLVTIARWLWPVATMVVALALLLIGFKTTYLDNATFGASLSDWAALVIWGLAAYGARKTLTGLGASATAGK